MKYMTLILLISLLSISGFTKKKVKIERKPASNNGFLTTEKLNKRLEACAHVDLVTRVYDEAVKADYLHFYKAKVPDSANPKYDFITRRLAEVPNKRWGEHATTRAIAEGKMIYDAFLKKKEVCMSNDDFGDSSVVIRN